MGFFTNVGADNADEHVKREINKSFESISGVFFDSVRNSIGYLSESVEFASQLYFNKRDYSSRLKCCLFYALYNISVNASEASPQLIGFFLEVMRKNISITDKLFFVRNLKGLKDEECTNILNTIFGQRNNNEIRNAFNELQAKGLLRERKTCPFEVYRQSAVSFLDFVGMTLNNGPWPEYDSLCGQQTL